MNPTDVAAELAEFPHTCPECNGHDVAPARQHTNFREVEEAAGGLALGSDPVSVTRVMSCRGCGHSWEVTGPV